VAFAGATASLVLEVGGGGRDEDKRHLSTSVPSGYMEATMRCLCAVTKCG